ncbi:MAG: 2-oxoglutarate dehydrogenase complex dihydrolipoyllysine-residue succinyltransferase [Anaerolineaceae bacterium]|nr:2-oxoglutarate dehydrogenase complex dihydrolipoyllysine-residue succinyltransferase [Anaerolineaceae bacterium]
MTIEIKVPQMGESVVEATVGEWLKKEGDTVNLGDVLVELETDKVDVEVGAESSGVLGKILVASGEDVQVGDVLGTIDPNGSAAPSAEKPSADGQEEAQPKETPAQTETKEKAARETAEKITPVAQRMASEEGVDVSRVKGSGPGGKVTKNDVAKLLDSARPVAKEAKPAETQPRKPAPPPAPSRERDPREERVKMSRRRRTIAARLVEAQQTAAMLTTFNEIDMSAVMELRKRRQDAFVERHGVKVGFTSFFVKATVGALKAFPRLNAEIDGDEMVLKSYYDIGIAVGAEEGLVVPVLRDADRMSFATIEQQVKEFAKKSQDGSLTLDDLRGGTFTITNGGVFGSMLSTPILNPPQVGILGLHNIVERPVVINGEMAIRPIMYVALSYDHRIVDGREAVQFLVRVKELIEDPESLLLEG